MIGAGAALLALGKGRVAGISGILGRCVTGPFRDGGWRLAFLVGLVTPAVVAATTGLASGPHIPAFGVLGWGRLILAAALVGLGTSLAHGCTSGHGICGLARLSPRSAVAVAVFMAAGMLTVALSELSGMGGQP